jgi:pSer/pThr/pTyr-binding forkhead associated (FHA) protein
VSRRHAKISRNGKQFILEDLNSTNGTTVNGRELNYQEKYALTGGDRIRFADVNYLFL